MRISRRILLASAVVVALGSSVLVAATLASPASATASVQTATDASAPATDIDIDIDDSDWSVEDEAEWMAESNAEATDLAAYLAAQSIEHTLTTDEDGWMWVDYNWDDQATSDAVDDFYWERYPWTPEEIDANNAEEAKLVAYLAARGIDATLTADRHGIQYAEYADEKAIWELVDDFYWELDPWTEEEIAAHNADTQDLVAWMNDNGIAATLSTDRHGLQYADFVWDEAIV